MPVLTPMLATLAERVPSGPDWAHEVKWDGMRVLVDVRDGSLRVTSRTGKDASVSFPELGGLAAAYDDMLLDGEVVAMEDGRPSFSRLADRMHVSDRRRAEALVAGNPVQLMIFDVLRLLGQDLTGAPWQARRRLLEQLDLDAPSWKTPPTYDDGPGLHAATREQGLEGIVSKRRTSLYHPGRRSEDWLKSPHRPTVSAVVGGWRHETDSTSRLGAVLLGLPDDQGGWAFAGRMGSGLAGRAGVALHGELTGTEVDVSPFSTPVPRVDARGAVWVEPRLVVEARTLQITGSGRLRQPTYLGVRRDLRPEDLLDA